MIFNTAPAYRTQQIMDAGNKAECACCGTMLPEAELNDVALALIGPFQRLLCEACEEREEGDSE